MAKLQPSLTKNKVNQTKIEQPLVRGRIRGQPPAIRKDLSRKSTEVLESIGFDPIEQLVVIYDEIVAELVHQDKWKNGEVQPLDANGRYLKYSPRLHMEIYDRLITISEKLLSYGYAKVQDEGVIHPNATMVVNLHEEGTSFFIGNQEREVEDAD